MRIAIDVDDTGTYVDEKYLNFKIGGKDYLLPRDAYVAKIDIEKMSSLVRIEKAVQATSNVVDYMFVKQLIDDEWSVLYEASK